MGKRAKRTGEQLTARRMDALPDDLIHTTYIL